MKKRKHKKWRRMLAYLRKSAVAIRNILIFAAIVAAILWCRSQISRDEITCRYNEAVAKITRGPAYYLTAAAELRELEAELSQRRPQPDLLQEVRAHLSQCCVAIAREDELVLGKGATWWYQQAYHYNRLNDDIPAELRERFQSDDKDDAVADMMPPVSSAPPVPPAPPVSPVPPAPSDDENAAAMTMQEMVAEVLSTGAVGTPVAAPAEAIAPAQPALAALPRETPLPEGEATAAPPPANTGAPPAPPAPAEGSAGASATHPPVETPSP